MPAGHSAADEAARYKLEAEQAEYAARTAQEMHRRYQAAAATEARLGRMLEPLAEQGFHILADRLWPGSRNANVDFVIVGPSGVLIVDAKSWGDVHLFDHKVFQGSTDVTDRFENLRNLADRAQISLAEIGMAPGEIRVVAVLMGKCRLHGNAGGVDLIGEDGALDYILNRGARLRPSAVDAALAVVEDLFRPQVVTTNTVELLLPDVILPVAPSPAVVMVDEIERALLASILAAPIEDWMAFLHPDQAKLARRSFNGPSRIRGAAGTGKTVVGLHRAAYLARNRPGRVLVTTLVRTLPTVMKAQMERMAPDVADRIEFVGIHAFARGLLKARGVPMHVNDRAADYAFDAAWEQVGAHGILGDIDPNIHYWKEEVLSVIKGRGLTRFDQYAELARAGRRRGLSLESRKAVWELYCEYNVALREAGIHDFADIILLAEKSLRANPLDGYSAVIADEAQDLSCSMIRMLHALVGDKADGLNLIGDGQQTIYAGGYTLAEADVSIAGRGVIMTTNYRNTVEIAEFAASMVLDDEFMDIEGTNSKPDVATSVIRHGMRPRVSRFNSRAGHDRSLVAQVQSLISAGTSGGDIAVLTQTTFVAREVLEALAEAGIPAMDLVDYDGRTTSSVKVGTIKRAKGLEFKQVLVARASAQLLETAWSSTDEAAAERRELDRRELYVAMTRARDGVWVGVA
ncbi:MAG TPA: UvrD-helicase domain-containing protein [Galbitalea sp.]|nr:UvrD-helicase domain-containing protein [Galbitalea sp.]